MEKVIGGLLSDYGVIPSVVFFILGVSFWVVLYILGYCLIDYILKKFSHADTEVLDNKKTFWIATWSSVCTMIYIIAYFNLPGPLDIAEKYASQKQKQKLYGCLKNDLGLAEVENSIIRSLGSVENNNADNVVSLTGKSFSPKNAYLPKSIPTLGDAIYLCKLKSKEE